MRLNDPKLSKEFSTERQETKKQNQDLDAEYVPPYLRMVVHFTLFAIEEQDFLTEDEQEILRFVFPGSDRDDLSVETDKLRLTQKSDRWRHTSDGEVFVRRHLGWRLGIRNPPSGEEDKKCTKEENERKRKALPPRPAAWIILLHDLAWNWRPKSIDTNLVHELLAGIENSSVSPTQVKDQSGAEDPRKAFLNAEDPGWAWYKEKDKDKWVHFHFPKLDTFRQLDRFLMVWNDGLPTVSTSLRRDELVRRWVFAGSVAKGSEDRYKEYATGQLKMPKTKKEEDDQI